MSTTTSRESSSVPVEGPFFLDAEHHRSQPTAPVPENAKGPAVPNEGYVLKEIADGIFWVGDGSYQTMLVVTDEGVIAVDAPPTLGHNILRAIRRVTKKPITEAVYSHHHSDHRGAMSIYPVDAPRHAPRATAQRLELLNDPHRPLATHAFDDTVSIDAGDHTLNLSYPGPNHSASVDLSSVMAPVGTSKAWAVFRAYLDAVAAQTADEVVPRWKDRLGGADVFTLPNAWAMAESLRLDLNSLGPFATGRHREERATPAGSAGRAAIRSGEAIPMKPDPSAPGLCRQAMPAPKEGHRCRSGPIAASPCRGVLGPRVELNHVWM